MKKEAERGGRTAGSVLFDLQKKGMYYLRSSLVRYSLLLVMLLNIGLSLLAQQPYTNKVIREDTGDFQFVIMADRTGSHREGVFEAGISKVNLLQPDFVMSVGDLIEGYKTDGRLLKQEWAELDSMVGALDTRFYYVAGNHDYSNTGMASLWQQRMGAAYYHFRYKDCLFLCVNSEDSPGSKAPDVGAAQYAYFRDVIAANKDVRWTFVFMHQPLWLYDNTPQWGALERLLPASRHTVFAGHIHRYTSYVRQDSRYLVLGTTGGVSWLKGKAFGEVDHVTRVAWRNGQPVISNLLLDGILAPDFVTDTTARIFTSFASRPPVYLQPLYFNNMQSFSQATLVVTNEHPYPLVATFQALANADYVPLLPSLEVRAEPHTTQKVTIPVQALHRYAIDTAATLVYMANCRFLREGGAEINWEQAIKMKPLRRYPLRRVQAPVVVDGRLDEWERLSYQVADKKGKSPLRYAFDLRYDTANVYIAVDVKDEDLYIPPATAPIEMDGIIITIDGNDSSRSVFNTADIDAQLRGEWRYLGIVPAQDSGTLVYRHLIPAAFKGQYRRTRGGYTAELSFPLAYLSEKQGRDWRYLRFNITVVDRGKGQQPVKMDWQPFWSNNVPGTGMFFR
ncbi:metallophosphoesterase [Chitinophaga pendula]|uniref:metallophosphoesterase n=1 Tax=Chitinophaga TaxID=79328 RepID=UPI000BAEAD65|nr:MULTISPECIES: metallophosphoesterase [Chitinophaga]ASZ13453.1 hypothetical protein CK934_22075 [Chitinophaga sp. MD30]UCJ08921.1 metallophosphoesterase [Chitinophaga pendula]